MNIIYRWIGCLVHRLCTYCVVSGWLAVWFLVSRCLVSGCLAINFGDW